MCCYDWSVSAFQEPHIKPTLDHRPQTFSSTQRPCVKSTQQVQADAPLAATASTKRLLRFITLAAISLVIEGGMEANEKSVLVRSWDLAQEPPEGHGQ